MPMKQGGMFKKKYHNSVLLSPTPNPNFEAKKNWTMRNLLLDFDLPHVADSLNGVWMTIKNVIETPCAICKDARFERVPNLLWIFRRN